MLWNICRDLYLVLLVVLIAEQIPGADFLHDFTRNAIIVVTVVVVVVKLVQPVVEAALAAGPGGQKPKRQKKTEVGKTSCLEWASSEMQGWRPAMEDATLAVNAMDAPLASQALFAVFDGHGGSQVSQAAAEEFPKVLLRCVRQLHEEAVSKAASAEGESAEAKTEVGAEVIDQSMYFTMLALDELLRKRGSGWSGRLPATAGPMMQQLKQAEAPEQRNAFNLVGSTAIVVLVDCLGGSRPRRLSVANLGDSRAVLCRKGRAEDLSQDHKPECPREEERIRRAGGHVAAIGPCYRIDGWGLNLSRALGDFHYKARSDLPPEEQKVSAAPEVYSLDLNEDDEFVVLCCDGVLELLTSQDVVDIIRQQLQTHRSVARAVEHLLDRSVSDNLRLTRGKGADNCSAVVVMLK